MGRVLCDDIVYLSRPVPSGISLNDTDWDTIADIAKSGKASNYFSVGDTKTVLLNGTVNATTFNNVSMDVFILGFDHNYNYEGKNTIHFSFGKMDSKDVALFNDDYNSATGYNNYFLMNPIAEVTNAGGWISSHMRRNICGTSLTNYTNTIIGLLPDALRKVLRPTRKYTDNIAYESGSDTRIISPSIDYLFLPGVYEILTFGSSCNNYESIYQKQYDYYANGNSVIRYRHNDTSKGANWWLRSPSDADTLKFACISSSGAQNVADSDTDMGIVPCFSVGEEYIEDTVYTVSITGTGNTNYAYVEVNGVTYTSAATLNVPYGTEIVCHVACADTSNASRTHVCVNNGKQTSNNGLFVHGVKQNCTVRMNVPGSYGNITIDET